MNFYPDPQTFSLRDELHGLFHGTVAEPGIGRPLVVRRLRDEKCGCWNKVSGSPIPGCRYCKGEGYVWTETMNIGYMAKNFGGVLNPSTVISNQNALAAFGVADENRALVYFEYMVFPNYERYLKPQHPSWDSLFEVKVDDDGRPLYPLIRTAKWKIKSVTPHHGDRGAVDYFECGVEKESI